MVESKAWNWELAEEEIWNRASEDVYYYVYRWKEKNYKDLLDLGCGLGRNSILFANNGFSVSACDLSSDAIETVNNKCKEQKLIIETKIGDMLNLPYENDSFDCLLSYHVISHTDSEGIVKVIEEIERVLRPDGEFYLTLCSKDSSSFKSGKYPKLDDNSVIKNEGPEINIPHFFVDLRDIRVLFKRFELLKIRHTYDIFSDYMGCHYFILGKRQII
jgi:SAM-dependent methyltransferase